MFNRRKDNRHFVNSYFQYADLGFRFALTILICLFGGKWLDDKLNSTPIFLLIGVLIGATSGFISIYRTVYPPDKKNDLKDNEK